MNCWISKYCYFPQIPEASYDVAVLFFVLKYMHFTITHKKGLTQALTESYSHLITHTIQISWHTSLTCMFVDAHTHTQVMNFLIKHIPPSPAYTLMSNICGITGIIANTLVFLMIPVMLRYFRLSVYIKKQCNASKFSIAQVCDQMHQETHRFMTIKSELFPKNCLALTCTLLL